MDHFHNIAADIAFVNFIYFCHIFSFVIASLPALREERGAKQSNELLK